MKGESKGLEWMNDVFSETRRVLQIIPSVVHIASYSGYLFIMKI